MWITLAVVALVVFLPVMACLWILAHLCRAVGVQPEELDVPLGGYLGEL